MESKKEKNKKRKIIENYHQLEFPPEIQVHFERSSHKTSPLQEDQGQSIKGIHH